MVMWRSFDLFEGGKKMTIPEFPVTRIETYLDAIAQNDISGIPESPVSRTESYLAAIAQTDAEGIPEYPIPRIEAYLHAIATGDNSYLPEYPITRIEFYLEAIALGDTSGIPAYPISRLEHYLDEIAQNGGGGGTQVTIAGIAPLLLANALAKPITKLTQYGKTEYAPRTYLDTILQTGKCEQRDLPRGYTRLQSIHFDGASYFNSLIAPNTYDYEIETKCSFDRASSTPICAWGFMGSQSSTPRWVLASYVQSSTDCYILNANITVPFSPFDTDAHVFRGVVGTENNTPFWSAYLDGTRKNVANLTLTERWEANTLSIYIGARNNNGTAGNFFIGDCYYHKVYKAGVLIQHLVAARRDADSVLGMYDLVSGTFLTNEGTGTLTARAVVKPSPAAPMPIYCNNGKLVARHASGLPNEYTLVENVRNASSTVATTNINDDVDDVEYEIRVKPAAGSWYIFQSRASANAYIYGISGSSSGNTITFNVGGTVSLISDIGARSPDHIYLVRASHKNGVATLYVRDEITGDEDTKTATYDTADYVASQISTRFWGNSQNTVNANNYIYHAKMRKGGELVIDAVPVTYSGEAGLYDYVSGTFIGATQGSLIAGAAVPDPMVVVTDGTAEELTVSGGQMLDPTTVPDENRYILSGTGAVNITTPSTGTFRHSEYIPVEGGATYKLGMTYFTANAAGMAWYSDADVDDYISGVSGTAVGSANGIVTAPANAKYIRFSWHIEDGYDTDWEHSVYLCKVIDGTPVLSKWEQYRTPQIASVENLLAVGDVADTQEIIGGAVIRNIGVKVIDGTETTAWTVQSNRVYASRANLGMANAKMGASLTSNISDDANNVVNSYGNVIIYADWAGESIDTAEKLNAYFAAKYAAGTPAYLIFPLAEAVTESVTPQITDRSVPYSVSYTAEIGDISITTTQSEHTTPGLNTPLPILCNNGEIKAVNGQIVVDGTAEVLSISELPPRYRRVEWLTATQPTDVGIKTKRSFDIYAKAYRTGTTSQYLYQSDSGSSLTTNTTAYTTASGGNWRFGNRTLSVQFPVSKMVETRQNRDGVWLNGEAVGTYTNVGAFTSVENFKIAGATSGGATPTLQIYYVYALDDGVLVLDAVPVLDTVDNVYGWYDKVSGQFFTNPEATYTPGPEVPSVVQTASVDNLFAVGDVSDEQEIIGGVVTRNTAVCIYDGTQQIGNDYMSTTGGKDIGAIIVYPLDTPTTESVTAQPLNTTEGDNRVIVTAEVSDVVLEAVYTMSAA